MTTWTRETLTAQILKDFEGLLRHLDRQDDERGRALTALQQMDLVKQGCAALLTLGNTMDTREALLLAVAIGVLIRETLLEYQAKKAEAS